MNLIIGPMIIATFNTKSQNLHNHYFLGESFWHTQGHLSKAFLGLELYPQIQLVTNFLITHQ